MYSYMILRSSAGKMFKVNGYGLTNEGGFWKSEEEVMFS